MKAELMLAVAILSVGLASAEAVGKVEIVLPEKANAIERYAADELAYHLKKAGATDVSRRFYLGRAAAEKLGVGGDAFDAEEHLVKGVGTDVFLLGGDRLVGGDRGGPQIGTTSGRVACGTLYAVYDFLETEMGVRWIWPGELGEVVPKRAVPAMDGVSRRAREPLELRKFSGEPDTEKMPSEGAMAGWADVANARKDCANRRKFLIRHRLGARRMFNGSHAFTDWWEKYGKTNPEFFNLLPNGKREPLEGDEKGRNVTLCVSRPELWKEIVRRWMKSGYQRPRKGFYTPCVNCCENDTPGMCTCENCRAWDAPDPRFAENDYWNLSGKCPLKREGRFRRLADVQWGETGGTKVLLSLPSVSDRYAKFYNAVLAEARTHVPEAEVYGYAYANYLAAPKETKVSDGVIISFVPRMYFPYTQAESDNFRREWTGWRKAGAKQMIYRPNYMLAGANFPYNTARRIADDFAFAADNGMRAVNQDSLTGVWSAQAIQNYVVTRLMREPKAGYEKALQEFASAFSPAEREIKDYCAFLEDVGKGLSVADWQELGQRNKGRDGNAGGGFKNFVLVVADVYTEEWFAQAKALLDKAERAAADNAVSVARIGFLKKGLEDARLTLLTRKAQKSGDKKAFKDALKRMDDYRASVEADGICSYYWTATREMSGAGWFRSKPKKAATDGIVVDGEVVKGIGARLVRVKSTYDGTLQPCYFWAPEKSAKEAVPLVVGLHTWSYDWRNIGHYVTVLDAAKKRGWAMVGPNFRGPNDHPEACGGEAAVQDIVDAVEYAKAKVKVDSRRIYIVGGSGGGHMTLLMAGRHPEIWAGCAAFCPITDLARWHADSLLDHPGRGKKYAKMLEGACDGKPEESPDEYRRRSPLTWLGRAKDAGVPVSIVTGIHDGWTGSVPVGHAIRAFNALAEAKDRVGESDIAAIEANRTIPSGLVGERTSDPFYGEKIRIHFRRTSRNVRLTLFEGGHGGNFPAAFDFLSRQTKGTAADFALPKSGKGSEEALSK